MGLQAAFDLELSCSAESQLSRLRMMAIQQLQAGSKSSRHPWHTAVVSTIDNGQPRARTVVLRAVEATPLKLRFHTDSRSSKLNQLRQNPLVEWLFYEPTTRIQLRVEARANVVTRGELWNAAWSKTSLPSRRCYLAPRAPGTESPIPSHNLPDALTCRNPTQEESGQGQYNFAVIETIVQAIEWLYLKHSGHLRCRFTNASSGWKDNWIEP